VLVQAVDSNSCGVLESFGIDTSRIDSITGNILQYSTAGNCYLLHEIVSDSLRSRLHDPLNTCGIEAEYCMDTSNVYIFGASRRARRFGITGPGLEWYRSYTMGIGLDYFARLYMYATISISLEGCVINGVVYGDTSFVERVRQISSEIPSSFSLFQDYPNPFNPDSKIKYQISKLSNVKLKVYDITGREVTTLVNQQQNAGTYELDFNGSDFSSGIYLYSLFVDGVLIETKKMVLLK